MSRVKVFDYVADMFTVCAVPKFNTVLVVLLSLCALGKKATRANIAMKQLANFMDLSTVFKIL
jgi:hypothetical protein